jgi:hypothetical protein
MSMDLSKLTAAPWVVDKTKALGAYGVWTDYATHPGHDGAGYPSQICSVVPNSTDTTREERDANAAFISLARNAIDAMHRRGWGLVKFPVSEWAIAFPLSFENDAARGMRWPNVYAAMEGLVQLDRDTEP